MTDTPTLRPVAALARPVDAPPLPDAAQAGPPPEVRWVSPAALWVDDRYQRGITARSAKLVHKIVDGWDWAKFKPPVVVEVFRESKADPAPLLVPSLHVIDGQHTATAAHTRGIPAIPVLVVRAPADADRAASFVAHNTARTLLTPGQVHHAKVAAGDPESLDVERACQRAGVTVLRFGSGAASGPNQTLAINALHTILNARYVAGLNRVLAVCADARLTPLRLEHLRGVDLALFDASLRPDGLANARWDALVATALRGSHDDLHQRARANATRAKMLLWRAFGLELAKAARALAARDGASA